ncbi:MAG: hypothetical protein KF861_10680 [Planctomycetaceae bacterium]|nr:hypothetical protein [Planctomycetaceae bacterium]
MNLRIPVVLVVLCVDLGAAALGDLAEKPLANAPERDSKLSRVEQVLENWDAAFTNVDSSRVTFRKYEYDSVFLLEKRSDGEIRYQAPDRLLWMTKPVELQNAALPRRVSIWGERYQLKTESHIEWYIDRHDLMVVDHAEKTYDRIAMPPQLRNVHPTRVDPLVEVSPETAYLHAPGPFSQFIATLVGPLHFSAQLCDSTHRVSAMLCGRELRRFQGEFDWTIQRDTDTEIRLSGKPLSSDAAQHVSRVDVILNTATHRPTAVRLIDPAGTRETVYVIREMAINESWHRVGPPPVYDYRLLQTTCRLP